MKEQDRNAYNSRVLEGAERNAWNIKLTTIYLDHLKSKQEKPSEQDKPHLDDYIIKKGGK
ncbi:hypothetical protein KKG52_03830 [Patescibacteria group bacterium]|nr:hypothetical protein [Patescibacteria group bacterium]